MNDKHYGSQTISSNNSTICLDNSGVQIFPCRCGQIHRGEYAPFVYAQHDCLHDTDLMLIGEHQAICPLCGESWKLTRGD